MESINQAEAIYSAILDDIEISRELGKIDKQKHFLYISELFIQYCNFIGKNPKDAISYLKNPYITDYNSLYELNPEFLYYVFFNYNVRDYFMKHLYDSGLDLNSKNLVELNKGQFDTCVPKETRKVSKYNSTIRLKNSMLCRIKGIIYDVSEDETIEPINEGSIFLVHNPYSINEVLYTLQTLAGTDNQVIISLWGTEKSENQLSSFDKVLFLISLLDYTDGECILDIKHEINKGIHCNSIIINTKNLKPIMETANLLTQDERKILGKYIASMDNGLDNNFRPKR